jgi:hypothetical protein
VEELWRSALEGMSHELKNPADDEERSSDWQQGMRYNTNKEKPYRDHDHWNANGMQDAVHRIPVAVSVLCDPFVVRAFAQHLVINLQDFVIISSLVAGWENVVY